LGALGQTDIKRLLGYSSIGHAGYLLIGLAAGSAGTVPLLYYLLVYVSANLMAFLVLANVEKLTGGVSIEHFRGLSRRSPFLAAMMFLALLSLAGIPPLGGFFAKFSLLLTAFQQGLGWLALVGAAAVPVSLYYYLSVVRAMYVDRDDGQTVSRPDADTVALTSLFAVLVLTAGWLPQVFWRVLESALPAF
jgi:NADH-quinone oxidoreductase subunit N